MRRFALGFALAMLLGTSSAAAQTQTAPRVEIAGGYSLFRASSVAAFNLQGGSLSIAANVNDWLGFAGDVGYYQNKNIPPSGFGLNITSYMFGPRLSYRGFKHFTPFVQQLVGAGHAGGTLYTAGFAPAGGTPGPVNGFAMATGAGLDVNLNRHLAIRAIQAEWVYTKFPNGTSNTQQNLRLTVGIVWRIGNR